MNVKIQGGGTGAYSNTGSCTGVTNYLAHEDIDRLKAGEEQEHFFTHDKEKVSAKEVTYKIDNNKAKLCKSDAKFFVITVSPSKDEIKAMGATKEEQTATFKAYINNGIMNRYAENFGKGLTNKDMMYYAKVHHTRDGKTGDQMHAHIIVSRKDMTNTKKLSPQTNHRGNSKGAVKSGFDRDNFFRKCEQTFDKGLNYERDFKQSYDFQNTMKNGTLQDKKEAIEKAVHLKEIRQQNIIQEKQEQKQEEKQEQRQEQQQERKRGLSR